VSESEFDEVMRLAAQDDESEWAGYDEWSEQAAAAFTEGDVENFTVQDGKVFYRAQASRSGGKVGAIEI
jgi:hypothetical protein